MCVSVVEVSNLESQECCFVFPCIKINWNIFFELWEYGWLVVRISDFKFKPLVSSWILVTAYETITKVVFRSSAFQVQVVLVFRCSRKADGSFFGFRIWSGTGLYVNICCISCCFCKYLDCAWFKDTIVNLSPEMGKSTRNRLNMHSGKLSRWTRLNLE